MQQPFYLYPIFLTKTADYNRTSSAKSFHPVCCTDINTEVLISGKEKYILCYQL